MFLCGGGHLVEGGLDPGLGVRGALEPTRTIQRLNRKEGLNHNNSNWGTKGV